MNPGWVLWLARLDPKGSSRQKTAEVQRSQSTQSSVKKDLCELGGLCTSAVNLEHV